MYRLRVGNGTYRGWQVPDGVKGGVNVSSEDRGMTEKQRRAEIVREWFACLGGGRFEAMHGHHSDDVVWELMPGTAEMLAMIGSGVLDVGVLEARKFSLDEVNEAVQWAERSSGGLTHAALVP